MQKVPILPTIPWQATPQLDADKSRSFPTPTEEPEVLLFKPIVALQAVNRSSTY
jgi:hypothetical protein